MEQLPSWVADNTLSQSRNPPPFMEPECTLLCSQETATGPFLEPDECKLHPPTPRKENEYIEDQIKAMQPTEVFASEKDLSISREMILTIVDGKVCSAITEPSSVQNVTYRVIKKEVYTFKNLFYKYH
jgi:hypothetical protein